MRVRRAVSVGGLGLARLVYGFYHGFAAAFGWFFDVASCVACAGYFIFAVCFAATFCACEKGHVVVTYVFTLKIVWLFRGLFLSF